MGMTGSGKSSVSIFALASIQEHSLDKQFIQLVTGDPRINIGHGVRSETSEIGVYDWTAPDGRVFALVDSPGFDDSNGKTDTDVLDQIAGFLKET
jgi:predicted GTPase